MFAVLFSDARGDHDDGQALQGALSARMLRARSKPSMRGISMSDSTTAGSSSCSRSSACRPSAASDHAVAFALQQALRHAAHRDGVVHHQTSGTWWELRPDHHRHISAFGAPGPVGFMPFAAPRSAALAGLLAIHRSQGHRVVDQHHAPEASTVMPPGPAGGTAAAPGSSPPLPGCPALRPRAWPHAAPRCGTPPGGSCPQARSCGRRLQQGAGPVKRQLLLQPS
jgi:hypothetical protein